MARNGKIARIPLHIRNELNKRLSEGESGVKLVRWLNEEVRFFLYNDFESRRLRITVQNLSEWRQGGYQDWLRHEEARQFIQDLAERAGELDQAADGKGISDRFGALLAVDMARLAKKFLEEENDPEKRWERLKEISKELSRLRRDEHRAVWTWIKREQWERQQKQEADEAEDKRRRRERVAALFDGLRRTAPAPAPAPARPVLTKSSRPKVRSKQEDSSGRSPKRKVAGKVEALEDTSASGSGRMATPGAVALQPDSGKSGQIQPNPTKSNQKPAGPGLAKRTESDRAKLKNDDDDEHDLPKAAGNADDLDNSDTSGAGKVAASGTEPQGGGQSVQPEGEDENGDDFPKPLPKAVPNSRKPVIRRCRWVESKEPVERTHDFRGEPL